MPKANEKKEGTAVKAEPVSKPLAEGKARVKNPFEWEGDVQDSPVFLLWDDKFLNDVTKGRKETEIAIVSHNSFIGQYKDGKIGLIENGKEELFHCHPYKFIFNKI